MQNHPEEKNREFNPMLLPWIGRGNKMTQGMLQTSILTACLLVFSATQAATFGELADAELPARDAQVKQLSAMPLAESGPPPQGIQEPVYREYPKPWVLDSTSSAPRQRILQWSYGQQRGFDNPHTWEHLDNRFLWARWGNPLAPYTSATINDWWRSRGRDSSLYFYAPEWW